MSRRTEIQQLYVGYLGRAADSAGLDYWDTGGGANLSMEQLRANLTNEQSEYTSIYGGLTRSQMVARIYSNLFERAPDADGLAYWTTGGGASVNADQLIVAFINAATVNPDAAFDKLTLDNKVQVADYYTLNRGGSSTFSLSDARTCIDNVDSSLATVTTATTNIDSGSISTSSQTFTLTTAADNLTGTTGNDTFNGTLPYSSGSLASTATLTPGDNMNGGSGTDTLNIAISGSDVDTSAVSVQTTGIEKVLASDYESEAGQSVSLDLSLVDSSLTTVGTTGSSTDGDLTFTNVLKLVDAQMAGYGDLTVTYAAGVADQASTDAMTLTLNGVGTSSASPTFLAGGIETLNIVSSTVSNYVKLDTATANYKTINVSGAKALDLSAAALDTTVTVVDASAMTAGLTVLLGSSDMKFTGGSGNDVVNTAAELAAADTLDGGSGTDTLKISDADTLTSTSAANVSNFEVLDATTNDNVAYNASLISGLTKLVASATSGGNDVTFSNITSTITDIQVTGTEGVIGTLKTDTAADTVTLTYGTSTAGVTVAGQTTLNNYETINLVSQGGTNTTGDFSATSLKTLNISGSQSLTLGTLAGDTALATLDASKMTGSAALTMNATNGSTTAMTLTGTGNNDSLVGGTKADTITGGSGNDTIVGAAGNDSIDGGAGADSITGGAGTDILSGGDANDTFYVAAASDFASGETVDGGSGTDTLKFADVSTSLTATDVAGLKSIEQITYGATTNTSTLTLTDAVYTANGNTTLTIDATAATNAALTISASGLTSANSLTVNVSGTTNTGANNIVLGAGNDTVKIDGSAIDTASETITGGSGTDTLTVTANTGAGDITMVAGITGFEIMNFSTAAGQTYSFAADSATVASGATMTIDGSTLTSSTLKFLGVAETNGSFVMTGGNSNDTLQGGTMNDTISGGSGADSIVGGSGIDNLSGGAGDDVFNIANNGAGFTGLSAAETVSGGEGNDTLQTTAGAVISIASTDLTALSSIETIALKNVTHASTLTLTDAVFTANGLTAMTIDASTATTGVLTLSAGTLAATNSLVVDISKTDNSAGNNISLGAGNDTVKADNVALDNTTTIAGGSGTDTLTITANTGSGTITVDSTVTGFEIINFTSLTDAYKFVANDANVASGATMTVDGSSLTTGTLSYNGSAETNGLLILKGGTGIDTLTGGSKADTITGGSGADVITGGSGADYLTGGQGADNFVFTAVAESRSSGYDEITDFTSGTDKLVFTLDLSAQSTGLTVDATILTAAAGATACQTALSGNRGQIIYNTTDSLLYVNANNDNLLTTEDYTVKINPASTAANTVVSGDVCVTVTGGTGADSLVAGGGADSIKGGNGVDTIQGGDGNDYIDLTETVDAIDTVIFNGSAITSAGGNTDTVSAFASDSDLLTFGSTFLEGVAYGSAQTVTSDVASDAAGIAGAAGNNVILVLSDTGAGNTTTNIAAMFSSDFTSAMSSLVIAYDGTDTNIYYVGNNLAGDSSNTVTAASEVILIGVISGVDLGTGGLAQANFGSAV